MAVRFIVLQTVGMVARYARLPPLLVILGIGSLRAGEACASLGGDAASVMADASELHGIVQASFHQPFEVEEIVTDNGMRIREFLNRDGIVFAVTWAGPVLPDLQRLLGPQFGVYTAALAARQHLGLQRSVRVATPDLVVESDGHLRAYVGRAYLPAMVPIDVTTAELR